MKYIIIIGDGMADEKLSVLKGKTPLEEVETPNMDFMASYGELGLVNTLPQKLPKGSDVAILNILGYNPKIYYSGRGVLEAASLGIELKRNETALRCNLVNIKNNIMVDYSAQQISSKEAKELIRFLNYNLANSKIKFFNGVSYRHILIIKGNYQNIKFTPPHDIIGRPIDKYLPLEKNSKIFIELIKKSQKLLSNHPINIKREKKGVKPANSIWLWGQGKSQILPSFKSKYNLTGSVISAVDLIKGIGKSIKLDWINVPNITGYIDTNYKGKVEFALKSLEKKDFILIHIEAADEVSHEGNLKLKIKAIKDFDKKVIGPMLKGLKKFSAFKILVLCDHATLINLKTHSDIPVPFVIYSNLKTCVYNKKRRYNEEEALKSAFHFKQGYKLMDYFIEGKK